MINYKSPREIEKMRLAGQIVARVHHELARLIRPGITTGELNDFIRRDVEAVGGTLLFYKYRGFPSHSCISVNEEVVHGIPSKRRALKEGDIVSIDVGVRYKNYCGDCARTYAVGQVSEEARKLMEICQEALRRGVEAARAGNRISDIARAIQSFVESQDHSVVRKFVGHGIGRKMHEAPQVPNYVDPNLPDEVLKPGLVLAIEPMVNAGTADVETLADGWTVVTRDRKLSAHYEDTVAVTADGPDVLTALENAATLRSKSS